MYANITNHTYWWVEKYKNNISKKFNCTNFEPKSTRFLNITDYVSSIGIILCFFLIHIWLCTTLCKRFKKFTFNFCSASYEMFPILARLLGTIISTGLGISRRLFLQFRNSY